MDLQGIDHGTEAHLVHGSGFNREILPPFRSRVKRGHAHIVGARSLLPPLPSTSVWHPRLADCDQWNFPGNHDLGSAFDGEICTFNLSI